MYDGVAAAAAAMKQVGKGYRFAGTGPDAYDCSGSTMMAARAGGVSLPHNSAEQTHAAHVRTVRHGIISGQVARFWLRPGDLVFYYGDYPNDWEDISHVAMYVGWSGGYRMVVNATGDDKGVEYIRLTAYADPTAYGYIDH